MPIKKQNKKLKKQARPKTDGQKNATKQDIKRLGTMVGADVRRLGVMVEAMGDHVRLVAEQYGDIKKDIGEMKYTLDSHTEMIGSLMVDMTEVKADVSVLKKDMTEVKGLLKQKADQSDVVILDQRVLALEKN